MNNRLLTAKEAAEKLQVTVQTLLTWHVTKGLPAIKIGREWRFSERDIEKWVEKHKITKYHDE